MNEKWIRIQINENYTREHKEHTWNRTEKLQTKEHRKRWGLNTKGLYLIGHLGPIKTNEQGNQ